jgi:hypothetical protein
MRIGSEHATESLIDLSCAQHGLMSSLAYIKGQQSMQITARMLVCRVYNGHAQFSIIQNAPSWLLCCKAS